MEGTHVHSPLYGTFDQVFEARRKYNKWVEERDDLVNDWASKEVVRRDFLDSELNVLSRGTHYEKPSVRIWSYASYTPREDTVTDQGLMVWIKRFMSSDVKKYFNMDLPQFLKTPVPVANQLLKLSNDYNAARNKRLAEERAKNPNALDPEQLDLNF